MAIQVPTFNTLNLPAIYSQAEGMKTQRLQNSMLQREEAEAKRLEAQRQRYEEYRRVATNLPQAIAEAEKAGDFAVAEQMKKVRAEQLKTSIDMIKAFDGMVGDEADYKVVRADLIQAGVPGDILPEEYNKSYFKREMDKLEKEYKKLSMISNFGGEDILQDEAGNILERVPTQAKPKASDNALAGGGRGAKSGDSNSIRSAIASLYNTIYDPKTGEFAFTNPKQAEEAFEIAARAAQIWRESEVPISHNEAALRAWVEFKGDNDPHNIRDE